MVGASVGPLAVDVSYPMNPRLDASGLGADFGYGIAVDGRWVLMASGEEGVAVNEYAPTGADGPAVTDPDRLQVEGCWPNPATREATLSVCLGASGTVTLQACDAAGRLVDRRDAGFLGAGVHTFHWDVTRLPRGACIWLLRAGNRRASGTLTVVR